MPAPQVPPNRKRNAVLDQESVCTTGMPSLTMFTHPADATHKAENMHIREDFRNSVRDIDFLGMVTDLFGDSKEASDVFGRLKKSELWNTIKVHIDEYNRTLHIEETLYKPFRNMGNLLFDFAGLPFRFVDTHAQKVGNDDPSKGDPIRKPDICMIWPTRRADSCDVYWSQVLIPFEFKRSSKNASADPVQVAQTEPRPSKRPKLDKPIPMDVDDPNNGGTTMDSAWDRAPMQLNGSQQRICTTSVRPANHVPSERHCNTISYWESHLLTTAEYSESERLADQEQLAAYAVEVFSARGLKRHVLGLFIEGNNMELWYFNRSGSFGTQRVSFGIDFEGLFILLLMLGHATPRDLGFEPHITPPLRRKSYQADRYSGFLLRANRAQIKADSLRATYVIDREKLSKGRCFRGRGTMVWNVDEYRAGNAVTHKDGLVLKLSWQLAARKSEVEFLRVLKKSGVKLVPNMYESADLDQLSSGPHGKIQKLLGKDLEFDDRVLRAIVLRPRLEPITTLRFDKLPSAFISLVDTHYQVFKDAKLLHRDIHPENLMFWECKNPGCYNQKCSHLDGESLKPYLIDFDFAARVGDRGPGNDPTHRTVITPFLAIELAKDQPPPAQYRHDLESFFWSFWWIMTHYEEKEGRVVYKELPSGQKRKYQGWHAGSWEDILTWKRGFLASEVFDSVPISKGLEHCRPKMQGLRCLFDDHYRAQRREDAPEQTGTLVSVEQEQKGQKQSNTPEEEQERQERQALSKALADGLMWYHVFRKYLALTKASGLSIPDVQCPAT